MPQNTDRQIIERLLLPAMMQAVIKAIRKELGDHYVDVNSADELLAQVIREPLKGLSSNKTAKLVRRAERVTREALAVLDGQVVGIQYLAIAYFTASLAECGVITVGAESTFARAWDVMAALLSSVMGKLCRDDRGEQAAEILKNHLVGMGYYR